jgi:Tfp pilus assembly protein PilO
MWFNTRKQVINIISRHLIIAVAAIIVAVLACFFVGQEIVKISASLEQKEKLTELLALRVNNIQRLKSSLAILGDNDKKIMATYPSTDNILNFVGALGSLAKQNSVRQTLSFGNFSPVTAVGGISIFKTDYTISLTGTITNLNAYLEQLENIPFITKIGAVNLFAAPPLGWTGDSTITINGSLYAQQAQ